MAALDDIDMVADLNGAGDTTVSVHENDTIHGKDAVSVDGLQPPRDPSQPTKVDEEGTKDKPVSLRDQISSAFKGEENTPAAAALDGLVRDPITGQFVPKPAVDPNAAPAAEAAPAVAAPVGIDPEVFKSLPAETQVNLARTMEGIAQSQQRFASLEPIEQLIAPRVQAWAMNGIAPAQALNQLLALSDFATRDTPGFIKYLAEQNGVDLEELVLGAEPVDPQYKALQDKINLLEGHNAQETQQRQQAAHTAMVNEVTTFATQNGPDGKPLRPYWGELANEVLPFIEAVKRQNPSWSNAQVLSDAYDRACWGSPSVRGKLQAAADATREAERLRTGAAKVDAARNASVSVKTGAPTSAPAAPDDKSVTLRESIRNSMSAHS